MLLSNVISKALRIEENIKEHYQFEITMEQYNYENWSDSERDENPGLGMMICDYQDAIEDIIKLVGFPKVSFNEFSCQEMYTLNFENEGVNYSLAWVTDCLPTLKELP